MSIIFIKMKPALAWGVGYFTYLLFNNWDNSVADLEVPGGDLMMYG